MSSEGFKVLQTIGTRYLVAFLNLLLVFINAKVLGVEAVGLVAIVLASMNLAVMFNSIFCGSTIVYFMNRYGLFAILIPAYLWAILGSALAACIMLGLDLFPTDYWKDVYILAMLNSLIAANSRFLLGKARIGAFNGVYFLQGGFLFICLLLFYFVLGEKSIAAYLQALYLANLMALLISFFFLRHDLQSLVPLKGRKYGLVLKEMFIYGIWSNVDNLAETLSSRLNYFFVQRFVGLGGVGLLDGGTKISESVWHISRAVGYIVNGEVARSDNERTQRQITFHLLKWTFLSTLLVMLVILCIPEKIYTDYLFTDEFSGISEVIQWLSPGIVALACNTILSQYFIASGRVRYSALASCVGLLVLLLLGCFLVPLWGVNGGAAATSIAFCTMFCVSRVLIGRLKS